MISKIKEILAKENIHEYRIIKSIKTTMIFKNVFGFSSTETQKSENYLVFFCNNSSTYVINVDKENLDLFNLLIRISKNCINTIPWVCDTKFNKINYYQNETYKFNNETFLRFSDIIYNKLKKSLNYKFNIVLKYEALSQSLYTPKYEINQINQKLGLVFININTPSEFINIDNCICYNNLFNTLLNKLLKYKLEIKNNEFNGNLLFKAKAFCQILNIFIKQFYADIIIQNQSFFKSKDIKNKTFKVKFDLISLPYKSIKFDSEGFITEKKYLIKNGTVVNFLSNLKYSNYLNINSIGNADLYNEQKVFHQRIIFDLKKKIDNNASNTIICEFISLQIFNDFILGRVNYIDNNKIRCSDIKINIDHFLNNIKVIKKTRKWINNICCSDILYHRK